MAGTGQDAASTAAELESTTASASVRLITVPWPAHAIESHPWKQKVRGGTRLDREFAIVETMLPPHIAMSVTPDLPPDLVVLVEEAVAEISALDQGHGEHLDALAALLLRTESVASSKIEHEEASVEDFARALHGVRSNSSATSMVASTKALELMIRGVEDGRPLTLEAITSAHRALMAEDPQERMYAGVLRDMQNWIGGSDHSPRNALYIPPPHGTVNAYMDDLIRYTNRTDIPVLPQAAIAHAQFESIHPFTDGNGRIGRALINTILRKRGATKRTVVPLASALVARRDDYFDVLTDYRSGDAGPIIAAFSSATAIAARESRVSAQRIALLPGSWRDRVGRLRKGSAADAILESLPVRPIFSANDAEDLVGGSTSRVYNAINRLADAEIIRPLTDRKRNQVWGTSDLLDELEDLGARIESAARDPLARA